MSPAKKKSFESLEDSFLKALDLDEKQEEEQNKPSPAADRQNHLATPDDSLQTINAGQCKELLIAPDNMSVTLVLSGGEPISAAQIKLALEKSGIIHGVSPSALKNVEEISRLPGKTGKFLIASGTLPETRHRVKFPFLRDKTDAGHTADQAAEELDSAGLRSCFPLRA